MIDSVLLDYNSGNIKEFKKIGKFSGDGTIPIRAFALLIDNLKSISNNDVHLIFITDGEFNGYTAKTYSENWKTIGEKIKDLGKSIKINAIGFKNDSIKNIQDMKIILEHYGVTLVYNTLTKSEEILPTFDEIVNTMETSQVAKIQIGNHVFIEGQTIYTKDKLFDNLIEEKIPEMINGLSGEWIKTVLELDIKIGHKVAEICDKISDISNMPFNTHKDQYNELWKSTYDFYNVVSKEYLHLQKQYNSLKSRSVNYWTNLRNIMGELTKILNEVQLLNSSTLSEKQSFEKATNIKMSAKHTKALERRKYINAQKVNKKDNNIIIEQNNNIIKLTNGSTIIKMESNLNELNETYVCFYSMNNWEENINSLFGIPLAYKWRGVDDWNPSNAKIDNVSISQYMSLDAYHDLQSLHTNIVIPEHNDLYGKENYLKSSDTQCNAILPIATDPFFTSKVNLVKEQLAHMITGSSLGYRGSHIMLYSAVFKYCFNILNKEYTEKMENIIMLLVNTFKLLATNNPFIYDKERNPLNMKAIIYNIAIGNTAPYLFNNPWEVILCVMSANKQSLIDALQEYKKIYPECDNIVKFKIQIWKMILRYMIVYRDIELVQNIFTPKNFNLLPNDELLRKMKTEGTKNIEQYMLSSEKIKNKESPIINKMINKVFDDRKYIRFLMNLSEAISENIRDFGKSFIFKKMNIKDTPVSEYFTDEVIKDIFYWGVLELGSYGTKNCYPMKNLDAICREVMNKVNTKYDIQLQDIFNKSEEYKLFRQRMKECDFCPIVFTNKQQIAVNELFRKIQNDNLECKEFETSLCDTMGKLFKEICELVKEIDNIDVCNNLYDYVKNNNTKPYELVIKPNGLPFSAPSHIKSPYFLQKLDNDDFMSYYKPLGIYKECKQSYKSWAYDLHNYMLETVKKFDKQTFLNKLYDYVEHNGIGYEINDLMKRQFEEYFDNFT